MSALTVFIDEGGDSGVHDGLHYNSTRHEWFTLGAYVLRTENLERAETVRDQIMQECRCRQTTSLHYQRLKEDRRAQACAILASHSARAFVLASHKSNVRQHVNAKLGTMKPAEFYNWCCRLLLERVMEFAESDRLASFRQPEPLDLVFSENKGHNYEAMFGYFETCNLQAKQSNFKLRPKAWSPPMMERSCWRVVPHDADAGLQLADLVASAFLQAANSAAPNHDPTMAMSLLPILARDSRGRIADAGVTLWPLKKQGPIPTQARPVFEACGYKF